MKYHSRIKLWYQRARYGYSDRDCWNGDLYLSGIIAGIMQKIVSDGYGVAMSYADKGIETSIEVMTERRDKEWKKYIQVFQEYSKHGPAFDKGWQDEFGGVLDKDIEDSVHWLADHFTELWD